MTRSLKDIKTRLNTIKTTRTITNAMEKVAYSVFRKVSGQLDIAHHYQWASQDVLKVLFARFSDRLKTISCLSPTSDANLHLMLSSNRGMCGALNSKIVKFTEHQLSHQDSLFIIGRKGAEMYKGSQRIGSYIMPGNALPDYTHIQHIVKNVLKIVQEKTFANVYVHYSAYVNTLIQTPTTIDWFQNNPKIHDIDTTINIEEPDQEKLITLFNEALIGSLYGFVIENFLSEQAARIVAMETATKNADDLINQLNLQYNRKRQEKITSQIIEIINGANAPNTSSL